ncbi:MAG: tetratricopeptide repeat protein [Ruminococcus callidus]
MERFCLGEEAQQGTKKENEQDYLHNAQNYQQAGNAEMAFQQYMVAARDYGRPEAQFEVAQCYQNGTGVEKSEENAVVWYKKAAEQCDAKAQCALGACYYQALGVEKGRQRRPADGTKRRQLREMQQRSI